MTTIKYSSYRLIKNTTEPRSDELIMEESLAILVNGEAFSVTMQTPGMERELVLGLLRGEGLFKEISEATFGACHKNKRGFIDRININIDGLDARELINKRTLLSNASCGICGNKELTIPQGDRLNPGFQFSTELLSAMYLQMEDQQNAFIRSGGSHAAAIFDGDRNMLALAEDVGRHNAVDKAIGSTLLNGHLAQGKFLLVSGRISYEIVAKCFKASIPILAAVSAPSSLAVDFAKEFGITLLGFTREGRTTVFSHPERVANITFGEQ